MAGAMLALSAAAPAAEEPAAAGARKTFLEILTYGLEINVILGLLAFIGLFLLFQALLATRAKLIAPPALLRQLLDDIASADIEAARKRAEESPSLLAQVILPGLKLHDRPLERINQAIEGTGRRVTGTLRQRVTYLANIGVLSPMLGLLGTVLGLMNAFQVMGATLKEGSKPIVMTAHIGQAMSTTAVGLMVGIPAMAAYYLCLSRIGRISDEIEAAAEEVAAALGDMK